MRCGQHELKFYHAGVVLKLAVLYAVKFIGNISPSNIYLVKKIIPSKYTSKTEMKRMAGTRKCLEKRWQFVLRGPRP